MIQLGRLDLLDFRNFSFKQDRCIRLPVVQSDGLDYGTVGRN